VPVEILALDLTAHLELLQGAAQPVDAVGDLLGAVVQGGVLPGLQALEGFALGDEGFGGFGLVEGEGERGLDELMGVLLDCGGVGGEGFDAEGWVFGGAAGGFDEAGGGCGGGEVEGGGEEEERKEGSVCHGG